MEPALAKAGGGGEIANCVTPIRIIKMKECSGLEISCKS